jgi:hypothetical protein
MNRPLASGSGPMTVSASQTAIDARPADAELASYLTRSGPLAAHIMHILGLGTGGWLSALVFAFGLSLADTELARFV